MTLSTDIYILDPVDPQEVIDFCNTNLLKIKNPRTEVGPSKWDKDDDITHHDNSPGQGLSAWLMSQYRKSGEPLYPKDVTNNEYHGDDEDSDWGNGLAVPACFMTLDFDTSYGYQDEFGGCSTLHARYIVDLYTYLAEKGVRIKWKDEFTGDIHDGVDGIEDFLEGGDKANEWFQSLIPNLPKIVGENLPELFKD